MKIITRLFFSLILCVQCALAGGSIGWEQVKSRVAKSDPELVKIIERFFVVSPSGGGVRLGPHFGERHGERIAPYTFDAKDKKTNEECVLVIEESEDYDFTGRFKFAKRTEKNETHAEQAGAGQPATRPESKSKGDEKAQPKSEGRSR